MTKTSLHSARTRCPLGWVDAPSSEMTRGFAWVSLNVLAWQLSNTMDTSFSVELLDEAPARYDAPETFNTDQDSHFACLAFTSPQAVPIDEVS